MIRLIFLLTFITAIAIGSDVRAEITSWVDENGVRHFSDKPAPEGVESESKPEIITPEWRIKQIEAQEKKEEEERKIREALKKKESEALKSKGQDQTDEDKKVIDESDDSQDYDTIRRLRRRPHRGRR
jgi:DNA primase catalytic subunit